MRRKDREITDVARIQSIIGDCTDVRLAMLDNGAPYIVALNFGYELTDGTLTLYFHGALEGKKIDALKRDPAVYFQMHCGGAPIVGSVDNPCAFGWKYKSVAGSGIARFIDAPQAKAHALDRIIAHTFKSDRTYDFPQNALSKTCVFAVDCTDFTAKQRD